MTDDLKAELEAQRVARHLDQGLIALVRSSTLTPERHVQDQTLEWLRGEDEETREYFRKMLDGVAERAAEEADDEAIVNAEIKEFFLSGAASR